MAMSTTQKFLVEANRLAGGSDYFRWRAVGTSLGYSEAESDQAMQSLNDRKLVILLLEGDARMLAAGRKLALRLDTPLRS